MPFGLLSAAAQAPHDASSFIEFTFDPGNPFNLAHNSIMEEFFSLGEVGRLLSLYAGVDVAKLSVVKGKAVFNLRISDPESITKLEYFGRVANGQSGTFTQLAISGSRATRPTNASGAWSWRLSFDLEPECCESSPLQIFALFLVADLRRRNMLSRQESRQLQTLWAGDRAA
jgi:hypothetical protein